jgi:uncharacterized protein YecT (DUF1311 family)
MPRTPLRSALTFGVLAALAAPGLAVAQPQDEPAHPLDRQLDACVEREPSTVGTSVCLHEAHDAWDAELNRVYARVTAELAPEARRALRDAQRRWIAFRDAELAALAATLPEDGTMWPMVYADLRMQRVRQRALDLRDYWYLLHPEGGEP